MNDINPFHKPGTLKVMPGYNLQDFYGVHFPCVVTFIKHNSTVQKLKKKKKGILSESRML